MSQLLSAASLSYFFLCFVDKTCSINVCIWYQCYRLFSSYAAKWNNYYGKFSVPTRGIRNKKKLSSHKVSFHSIYSSLELMELRLSKRKKKLLKALIRKISTYVFSINVKFLSSANVLSSFFLTQTETSRNFQFSHFDPIKSHVFHFNQVYFWMSLFCDIKVVSRRIISDMIS
jgi:hypothetical protein